MPRSDQNTNIVIWTSLVLAACGVPPLTYEADVKPIVDRSCTGCHREGGIAPFALTTFEQVQQMRLPIKAAVEQRRMPPVLAAEGCAEYAHDTRLSPLQIATLSQWADSDALEGSRTEASA